MKQCKVLNLICPGCGASLSLDKKKCSYCGRDINISSSNVFDLPINDIKKYKGIYQKELDSDPDNSDYHYLVGICHLRTGLYSRALCSFEKAMEADYENHSIYFYAAISILDGKKAFLCKLCDIRKTQEYLNAAIQIENRGIYRLLLAYIKYDFYYRKFLNIEPDYKHELNEVGSQNLTQLDIEFLFDLLKIPVPEVFKDFF